MREHGTHNVGLQGGVKVMRPLWETLASEGGSAGSGGTGRRTRALTREHGWVGEGGGGKAGAAPTDQPSAKSWDPMDMRDML